MGLIFFAYGGFPRVAVMAEEVKNPKHNVPRAVLLSLLISAVVYVVVGAVAVGLVGPVSLAASNAPLTVAIGASGNMVAVQVLAIGGAVATASVLLAAVLGVSRMAFSMARRQDLPQALGKVHKRFGTPYVAIWIVGTIMSIIVLFADLTGTIVISTFGLVFGYIFANLSALKLKNEKRLYPKIIPIIGLGTSIMVMLFILIATPAAWFTAIIFLFVGVAVYYLRKMQLTRKNKN